MRLTSNMRRKMRNDENDLQNANDPERCEIALSNPLAPEQKIYFPYFSIG
jgi:hypothetical protein